MKSYFICINIYNLGNPTLAGYAVTKGYVDDQTKNLLKLGGTGAMTKNLNMTDHAILGVRSSSADNSVITVGGAKSTYLPLSGDRAMQGDLNMGGQPIINMKPFVEDDSSQTSLDAQKTIQLILVIFTSRRGDLKTLINKVAAEALDLKGENAMQGDFKMNKNVIKDKKSRS